MAVIRVFSAVRKSRSYMAWRRIYIAAVLATATSLLAVPTAQEEQQGSAGGQAQVPAVVVPAIDPSQFPPEEPLATDVAEEVLLGMTPEGIAAKERAEAGLFEEFTTKAIVTPLDGAMVKPKEDNQAAAAARELTKEEHDLGPLLPDDPLAPLLGGSFQAITFGESGFIPPDPTMAAGPNNLLVATNGTISTFTKGGTRIATQTLVQFFQPLGQPATDGPFDPKLVFDRYINRFWFVAVSRNVPGARSSILIGLSNTSDATAGWRLFATDGRLNGGTNSGFWCDYPQVGIDGQAIYLTCNMFSFAGAFQYSKLRIMTKDQFINNTCCRWWDFWDLREGFLSLSRSFTIQPAQMHGATVAQGEFLVNAQGGGGSGSQLEVRRVTNAQRCCIPGFQTAPDLAQVGRGVGSYSAPPNARQFGSATRIHTGDSRLLYAVWQNGRLSTGQTLACGAGGADACWAFTELNVAGYPGIPAAINDWVFTQAGVDFYYPQADSNLTDRKSVVFARSSASEFAGVRYAGIPPSSQCVFCVDGPDTVLRNGVASYVRLDQFNRNRWGDYFGASRDPNGTAIWIHGQFASGVNNWATQVGVNYQVHPRNDEFQNRQGIGLGSPVFIQDTQLATTATVATPLAPIDPIHSCGTGTRDSNTVWFGFTAPSSGLLVVNTFGSGYDTVLTAYGNTFLSPELACNDDFGGLQSQISFQVLRGTTYFIEVSDFGEPGGGNLRLSTQLTLPDLIVQSIVTNPAAPIVGQAVNVQVTVRNQGGGQSGPFWIDFYRHLTAPPGAGQVGDFSCRPANVFPSGTTVCAGNVTYGNAATFSMWAQADTDREVAETNEVNNVFGPQGLTVRGRLSVSKTGTGSGTVTSNPPGINCGPTCFADYAGGTVVTLTATPAPDSIFAGWDGACGGMGPCQINITTNHAVIATFQRAFTLTVVRAGTGTGTVTSSPPPIDCGGTCAARFASGTAVTLTATADPGSEFAGWAVRGCFGTDPCTLPMTQDITATAYFNTPASPPISYAAATYYTKGTSPQSVAVGDFNGDGIPDVAGGNFISDDVSVLLGDGVGGLGPATNFAAGTRPADVEAADLDFDGDLDLVVVNAGSSDVSVLLGDGAGSFGAPTSFVVGTNPSSGAVGDLNGDFIPDIAVANRNTNDVTVLVGDGAGGFAPLGNFAVGSNPGSIAIADFNFDVFLDVVVVNTDSAPATASVLLGDGAGSLLPATHFQTGNGPDSVAVDDVNVDGIPDLVTGNLSGTVSILLGDGSGGFGPFANFAAGNFPRGVAVADLNFDGAPDVAVANEGTHTVTILLGDGLGALGAPIANSPVGNFPRAVAVADFDFDGRPDLVVSNSGSHNTSILLNTTP